MKLSAITWVFIATFILLTVLIFSLLNFSFGIVFYSTLIGQAILVYTVYRVLTDTYTTTKTFEDFYEDVPKGKD